MALPTKQEWLTSIKRSGLLNFHEQHALAIWAEAAVTNEGTVDDSIRKSELMGDRGIPPHQLQSALRAIRSAGYLFTSQRRNCEAISIPRSKA